MYEIRWVTGNIKMYPVLVRSTGYPRITKTISSRITKDKTGYPYSYPTKRLPAKNSYNLKKIHLSETSRLIIAAQKPAVRSRTLNVYQKNLWNAQNNSQNMWRNQNSRQRGRCGKGVNSLFVPFDDDPIHHPRTTSLLPPSIQILRLHLRSRHRTRFTFLFLWSPMLRSFL